MLLQQIKRELLDSQQKVSSLQELSAQLLVNTEAQTLLSPCRASEQSQAQGSECLEAQEKVHVIWNRLKLLLREVGSDLEELERRLEAARTQQQVRRRRVPTASSPSVTPSKCYDAVLCVRLRIPHRCLFARQKRLDRPLPCRR